MNDNDREAKYGMDRGDFARFDHGTCWICGEPETVPNRSLAVDHNHTTGAVRGLLCTRCNQVIGRMNDNPDLLRKAAAYLEHADEAFAVACLQCWDSDNADSDLTKPVAILRTDGTRTMFRYECRNGHSFTVEHLTAGVPITWRI